MRSSLIEVNHMALCMLVGSQQLEYEDKKFLSTYEHRDVHAVLT